MTLRPGISRVIEPGPMVRLGSQFVEARRRRLICAHVCGVSLMTHASTSGSVSRWAGFSPGGRVGGPVDYERDAAIQAVAVG